MLTPEANIIKLPNVSASVPQLKAAVAELQAKGFAVPDFPEDPTDRRGAWTTLARYRRMLGSAVNPVLRQGNSDRRAPASVKNYARTHPHRMGAWSPESKTNVAHMEAGDFRSNEQSAVMAGRRLPPRRAGGRRRHDDRAAGPRPGAGRRGGRRLRDARRPSCGPSSTARSPGPQAEGVLFSVHLKATMMKVSDPIIFGHVVRAFFPETFAAYGDVLADAGLSPNDGWGAILDGLAALADGGAIRASFDAELADGPRPGHGRLRPGDHQPARAERRDRRRLDAGHDPHLGPHVGPGRRRGRHPRRHPRQQLRRRLPGRHRRLPGPRRLRPRRPWARSPTSG